MLDSDSAEQHFLQTNNVRKAYVRFFDIVVDKSPIAMDSVVPDASLQVKSKMQAQEIIPTIFITVDAIKKMRHNEAKWAEKIVKRICNMCSYNEIPEPREIQLDCDWTRKTDSVYFNLCREVKKELQSRNSHAKVSATIRLHQLLQTPPPVDYGVLMLYNTGSFENPEEPNSIISVSNIRPYLKNLADYPLHLDYAYPIFSWNLVYDSDRKFKGLINSGAGIPDNILTHVSSNSYEVAKDTVINKAYLHKGDIIRKEDAPFKTIMEVKELIRQNSRDDNFSIILYHLDKKNISNYTDDEFKQIYK
ncbi:MAG: hypothetical protein K2G24_06720 [Muribaculaceae bacterium]|nr:hypothetical protein [Muribaculaceae bacterium]